MGATRGTTTPRSSTYGSRFERSRSRPQLPGPASCMGDKFGDGAMNRKDVALAAMLLAGAVTAVEAQNNAAEIQKVAEEKAVNLCSTCHGPRGISTSPEFPLLAAQRKGYLEAQINAFRHQTRAEKDAHDFMWGIAGNLDEAIIGGIAAYYATERPAPGRSGDPALVAKGDELFDRGIPARGIPACKACHGADAAGTA